MTLQKKKQIAIFAVLAIAALTVVSLSWVLVYSGQKESAIKVGVVGHFSGEYANYGVPLKQAIELYIDEVNERGGIDGKMVELVIEDDGADRTKAASAVNKLIHVDKVDFILSAQGSGATSVIAPIAQSNGKILMITLGSAPDLTTGDYVFRSVPSDIFQGYKMSEFIQNNLRAKRVAGLYVNDAYGIGIKNIVESNVNIVSGETYEFEASDFRTQLTKIKNSNPDVLVLVCRKDAILILKQMRELGMDNITVIVDDATKDEEVLQKSGSNAEGVYAIAIAQSIDYVGFNEKYQAKFGEEPSAYSMYAYDGAVALVKAIDSVGKDAEKVKVELYNVKFDGASGRVGFDANGDRTGTDYSLYQIRNGNFVQIL